MCVTSPVQPGVETSLERMARDDDRMADRTGDQPDNEDARAQLTAAGVRVVEVTDPRDARTRDFTGLTDVALRSAREPAEGLFIAEGAKTIARAIDAGYLLRGALMSKRWLGPLATALLPAAAASGAEIYLATDDVVESVTGYAVHRGALASFARRELPSLAEVAAGTTSLIVLEDLTDHTNVGLIMRTAAALGVGGAVLSPRCADPLYRRAIRTSMGAVLTLPYAQLANWYTGISELRSLGFRTLALTPDSTATPLERALKEHAATDQRIALIVGSEGDGLTRRWMREADDRVCIPMAAGIDSLNVAAATAIACYLLTNRA